MSIKDPALPSGVASGIMSTGSAVAAIVSPLAFGPLTDLTGSYALPFLASTLLLLGGAVLTFWMRPACRCTRSTPRRQWPHGGWRRKGGVHD